MPRVTRWDRTGRSPLDSPYATFSRAAKRPLVLDCSGNRCRADRPRWRLATRTERLEWSRRRRKRSRSRANARSRWGDDLEDFERRTFAAWDRDSVSNDRGDRGDQFDDHKSIAFGPVPPELMERWIGAARTMDAIVLEALVRRTRRDWSPAELAPLGVAVAAQHRVFEQRAAIADATRHLRAMTQPGFVLSPRSRIIARL